MRILPPTTLSRLVRPVATSLVVALIGAILSTAVNPLDVSAQSGAAGSFNSQCRVIPAVTEASQAGLPAVGVGELVDPGG